MAPIEAPPAPVVADRTPLCLDCHRPAARGGLCRTCAANEDDNAREYDNPVTRWGA